MQEHVGAFRDFLRTHGGPTRDEQELMAAKLMGRWRSGAPLVLAPEQDDPALGADLQRTNDFNYATMDPRGYACPVGAHIRRMNPRDTGDSLERHQLIRRGGTYGPLLPEDAPDDGVGSRHRRVHRMREPGPPVRVRDERLGERSEVQGTRATSAIRSSARRTERST